MPAPNRLGAVVPHDPARALSIEIALSRYTSPEGWQKHTLRNLLKEADQIYLYLVDGTTPLAAVRND